MEQHYQFKLSKIILHHAELWWLFEIRFEFHFHHSLTFIGWFIVEKYFAKRFLYLPEDSWDHSCGSWPGQYSRVANFSENLQLIQLFLFLTEPSAQFWNRIKTLFPLDFYFLLLIPVDFSAHNILSPGPSFTFQDSSQLKFSSLAGERFADVKEVYSIFKGWNYKINFFISSGIELPRVTKSSLSSQSSLLNAFSDPSPILDTFQVFASIIPSELLLLLLQTLTRNAKCLQIWTKQMEDKIAHILFQETKSRIN